MITELKIPEQYSGGGWSTLRDLYLTRRAPGLDGVVRDLETAGVGQDTGLCLHGLIREHRPTTTLETGFAFGFSTLFILQAHAENGGGFHMAIDPVETTRWHGIGLANVKRAGLESNFEHIEMMSQLALPALVGNGACLDMAFVDGSHLCDETLIDAYYIDRMLKVGGRLVFDDWGWMPAVRTAVNFIEANWAYEVDVAHSAKNIRVLRKVERAARAWDHFSAFEVPATLAGRG